jgi:glutamate N-acetyltransferase/amino-acid N-acetyltransferase
VAGFVKVSPFAPSELPEIPPIDGVGFATAEAGIKYKNREDLLLAVLPEGTIAAGVTTRSKTCSAPVLWCREQLAHGQARALVVNSGNANAFTGAKGTEAVRITADAAAKAVGCRPEEIYIASTGVIGEPMDAAAFAHLLGELAPRAASTAWEKAARAIMTTDTYPKLSATSVTLGSEDVRIAGFVKGSGMIAPDMATMLGFIFTNARIALPVLQKLTREIADKTFNCITVDSDTSTSDTVIVFATGAAGPEITDAASPEAIAFAAALYDVMRDMAHQVVRDGEGLSKFVQITITGAETDAAAKRIGLAMANSPLLKTAIAGEDPNWGRVVMAVGKSGEAADRDKLRIQFGDILVAEDGRRVPAYTEEQGATYMKNAELEISVDVGIASGHAVVWTCDLTHDYVTINADYRS